MKQIIQCYRIIIKFDEIQMLISGDSNASTLKNIEQGNNIVVLSDSDNEHEPEFRNESMRARREVIQEDMESDEEYMKRYEIEVDQEDRDRLVLSDSDAEEEEEEDEEAEEGVRTDRQKREDFWSPKSIEEIEQSTRIHAAGKIIFQLYI